MFPNVDARSQEVKAEKLKSSPSKRCLLQHFAPSADVTRAKRE